MLFVIMIWIDNTLKLSGKINLKHKCLKYESFKDNMTMQNVMSLKKCYSTKYPEIDK